MTDAEMEQKFLRLNETLYDADPADYFYVRLLSLLAMAGRPDDVLRLLAGGASYAGLHVTVTDAEVNPDGVRDFVTVESQILLHHAAEAVVRLFLAHAGHPPCPWLEIAGERDFRTFKQKVEARVIKVPARSLNDDVADVFLGGRRDALRGLSDEQWTSATVNLVTFLRVLAERWLEDAPGYNSVKHGLSVHPSAAVARFGTETGETVDIGDGPSLAYLQPGPWDKQTGTRNWKITTQWLDVGESLGLVHVSRMMIESIWAVARSRYLGADGTASLFVPHDLTPAQLRTPGHRRAKLTLPTFISEKRSRSPRS